jgi:hypothetical protein
MARAKIEFLKTVLCPVFASAPIVLVSESSPDEELSDVIARSIREGGVVTNDHFCKLLKDIIA